MPRAVSAGGGRGVGGGRSADAPLLDECEAGGGEVGERGSGEAGEACEGDEGSGDSDCG